jgi:inorganic pyrophosphatase
MRLLRAKAIGLMLQRFFLDYKVLERERVTVEDLRGRADAERAIREAARRCREQVRPGPA